MQVPPADWSTGRTAGPLSSFAELRRATLRHPNMRMPRRSVAIPALLAFVVLVAACGTSAATPASSASPSSAPAPTANIIQSAADAARAVTNEVPLFAGIEPRDANLIGQATWYEATPQEAAKPPVPWRVVFRVGWGDCPAGCIDEHTWTYEVGVDGSVTFVTEAGSAVPPAVFETLRAASSFTGVAGRVTAGPTCPVERPGDTACQPRPVEGAALVVTDAGGSEVARVTTDASGLFGLSLQPGDYTLTPQPVEGLMGTAAPMPFTVVDGAPAFLDVAYDTGIR